MGMLSSKLRSVAASDHSKGIGYWCPGCAMMHVLPVEGPRAWQWDGNVDRPTVTPSVLARTPPKVDICHAFLAGGMIQFLGDSTHALAGQTVPLPDLPDHLRD